MPAAAVLDAFHHGVCNAGLTTPELAAAAKAQGVRRMVAVTTASAGTPWAPAAIFLNAIHSFSVKHKFAGEQAIRASGLDYIVLR